MALRTVAADRLSTTLLELEQGNDRRPEHPDEYESGQDRAARPYRLIAEDVEYREIVGEAGEHVVKHSIVLVGRPKTRLHRLYDRAHAAAERSFDHNDVARTQRIEQRLGEPLGSIGIGATAIRRDPFPQMRHERSRGIEDIDLGSLDSFGETGMK